VIHRSIARRGIRVANDTLYWFAGTEGAALIEEVGPRATSTGSGETQRTDCKNPADARVQLWRRWYDKNNEGYRYQMPDGFDPEASRSFHAMLGDQLMRPLSESAAIEQLNQGQVDPNYQDGPSLTLLATRYGNTKVLKALRDLGADVDAPAMVATAAYCFRTPLLYAIEAKNSGVAAALLDLGASAQDALDALVDEAHQKLARPGGLQGRQHTMKDIEDNVFPFFEQLQQAGARGDEAFTALKTSIAPEALQAAIDKIELLGSKEGRAQPNWADEVCALIVPLPEGEGVLEDVLQIIDKSHKHEDWPKVVQAVIDASPLFTDVAEDVYGQRIELQDDEGWLAQSWSAEEYSTLPQLLKEVLLRKRALKHPAMASIADAVLDRAEATDLLPSKAFASLLKKPEVKALPKFDALRSRFKALTKSLS